MPRLLRVEQALDTCAWHIHVLRSQATAVDASTFARYSEIESYLVDYLIGTIYAEFEQYFHNLILARCEQSPDPGLAAFARSIVKKTIRRIEIGELTGHLRYFDQSCARHFASVVNDGARGREKAAYDSLIAGRHRFSHASGSMMSFEDLRTAYRLSLFVLDEFEKSLALA